MIRYIGSLLAFVVVYLVGMTIAPILPAFASMRFGPSNNGHDTAFEPRLPSWLYWFDTSYDNSLWGDEGWRTKHCPKRWNTYLGMVLWLWRNCACGFSWSVLAWPVADLEDFAVSSSGCGLRLDKSFSRSGWFMVRSSRGAFHYRRVTTLWGVQFSFDAGWLLDVYVKDPAAKSTHKKAIFQFSPALRRYHSGK